MRPAAPDFFEAIPVSDRVNKVANKGPDLQERVEIPNRNPAPKAEKPSRDDDQMNLF